VTYRPQPVRLSFRKPPLVASSRIRPALTFLVAVAAGLLSAAGASADPTVASTQAQAQQVLGEINQIDQNLNAAVEAYNLANVRLHAIKGDLRTNKIELNVARSTLKTSQRELAKRIVTAYTSNDQNSTLSVLLGSTSLNDLLNRIETINATSKQDTQIVHEVTAAKRAIQRHRVALQNAKTSQERVVAQKAAERQHIESQLAQRRALLSSIRGEIAHLKAIEAARELQLAQAARARLAASPPTNASAPAVGVSASTPEGASVAPPNTHGGVVGIAMRYLGVPYVWGGASPRGFDCSGLVMYVFAQIGVSLPHSSYSQFGMGIPVTLSELQPGDLVFFAGASHVGIYIGGGQFIHAPHTGDVVKISSLTGWYAATFAGGRRI
jgi:cell wall-associated NlpC family hydrolase